MTPTLSSKTCTLCLEVKPLDYFVRYAKSKDGRGSWCRECHRLRSKAWREANPEKAKETAARYHAKNPTRHRASALSRAYGITVDEYDQMYAEQGGSCAICRTEDPGHPKGFLCVDHVAGTLKIRGLLCSACNSGIGYLQHNTVLLQAAINYLERPIRMEGVKVPQGVHRARYLRDLKEASDE